MSSDAPIQDTASESEDPEYYEQCLAAYEDRFEDYCEFQLWKHLSGPTVSDIEELTTEYFGPDPASKEGESHE